MAARVGFHPGGSVVDSSAHTTSRAELHTEAAPANRFMGNSTLWNMAQELRDVLPLDVLSDAEGRELYSHMHLRRFAEGEIVYHRGDPAVDTFVVHRGLVKALLQDENGRDLLVGLYGRGEFFGTLTLFQNEARESTVVA